MNELPVAYEAIDGREKYARRVQEADHWRIVHRLPGQAGGFMRGRQLVTLVGQVVSCIPGTHKAATT